MGLRSIERRLELMVEGSFARVFRSGLRPVEIGRRLVRVMDDNRSVGVHGETVAPNHFRVTLAPDDAERFAEASESLRRELADSAREHARDEGYSFVGHVEIEFVTDPERRTGTFRIDARLREPVGGRGPGSLLLPTGDRVELGETIVSLGRLPDSTIVLGDPNASRSHAEIHPAGTGFKLVDLGSTNGTQVNGARVSERQLRDADHITIGTTTMIFEAS